MSSAQEMADPASEESSQAQGDSNTASLQDPNSESTSVNVTGANSPVSDDHRETPFSLDGLLGLKNSQQDANDLPELTKEAPTPTPGAPRPGENKEETNLLRRVSDHGAQKMHRFSVYETQTRYYIVGGDVTDDQFRMLKIDRTAPPGRLQVSEDGIIYNRNEMNKLLKTIEDGNKAAGGMKLKANCWGLLGFIRFTDAYYMLMITKREQVAMIGGHFIHQVGGTELVPLTTGSSSKFQSNRNPEESHFLSILNNLDLHRSFYFSYSYNVTRTLQHNMLRERERIAQEHGTPSDFDFNDMFIWNHHLLDPAIQALERPYDWCVPIIHGFVDQSSVNSFGRNIYITLIARRSRFFAGARFLKRGVNDLGYVANDVETESIVADMLITPFNAPTYRSLKTPNYTSFVQHRGSIPLYWAQENTGVSPKPAIDLNLIDPFYTSTALHFDNLFERYGAPVLVLNLIKVRERTPRESKLLLEYQKAIEYLNQALPKDKKIQYRSYDMSRAVKTRGQDVIGDLEEIANDLIQTTGIFHSEVCDSVKASLQNGVIRSNCIDCLDRTNAAQFVIAKRALTMQLHTLGVLAEDSMNYDTDASNLFAHMFNDHGDTLATQYGGSHLVNTTDSYRKIKNWQSHSRDMLESFKRYYHNSFLDNQRQEAYNLFLGNYTYSQGQPMLWELPNDYYLHHANPSTRSSIERRDYVKWFTPEFLEAREVNDGPLTTIPPALTSELGFQSEWWREYYRPTTISSFLRIFAYKMNCSTRYLPKHPPLGFDPSPFTVRKHHDSDSNSKRIQKAVSDTASIASSTEAINPLSARSQPGLDPGNRIPSLKKWLSSPPNNTSSAYKSFQQSLHDNYTLPPRHKSSSSLDPGPPYDPNVQPGEFRPADKALKHQWTLRQFHANSLHPHVSTDEAAEYELYVSHPLRLPLVVSSTEADFADRSAPSLHDSNSASATMSGGTLSVPSIPPDGTSLEFAAYLDSHVRIGQGTAEDTIIKEDVQEFEHFLREQHDVLTVKEEDWERKRYQAYRKWLRGKSLFKQSKVDPEFAQGS